MWYTVRRISSEIKVLVYKILLFLQDVDVTDNPLFLSCKVGEGNKLVASFIVHGKTEETNYEILTEEDISQQFIIVRLQTRLPFMCNFQTDLVKDASTSLRKQVSNYFAFSNCVTSFDKNFTKIIFSSHLDRLLFTSRKQRCT